MKKLLFITPELPFPAQSGGKVKSMKLLEALAEKYVVTLACPLKLDDADHLEDFYQESPCKDHIHQPVAVGRTAGNLARTRMPEASRRHLHLPCPGRHHEA